MMNGFRYASFLDGVPVWVYTQKVPPVEAGPARVVTFPEEVEHRFVERDRLVRHGEQKGGYFNRPQPLHTVLVARFSGEIVEQFDWIC